MLFCLTEKKLRCVVLIHREANMCCFCLTGKLRCVVLFDRELRYVVLFDREAKMCCFV